MQKVIGIDEVGRGVWAGPLVVGAVILGKSIGGLKDSKLLSKKQREKLAVEINKSAEFIGIGWVSPQEVDDLGLTKATSLACIRALENSPKNTQVIIDGAINYLPENPYAKAIVNADESVSEVSAASIVAKVARDNYMTEQAEIYPNYGFETHVGYGTQKHIESIKQHGLTPLHRWSFKPIKKFMDSYEA
jgi:ribonuclease HII